MCPSHLSVEAAGAGQQLKLEVRGREQLANPDSPLT